jgi:hypothetical protein
MHRGGTNWLMQIWRMEKEKFRVQSEALKNLIYQVLIFSFLMHAAFFLSVQTLSGGWFHHVFSVFLLVFLLFSRRRQGENMEDLWPKRRFFISVNAIFHFPVPG